MNRSHDTSSYLATIQRLRTARPGIGVSGDFIVGFPGESEADFEATLALVREVRYAAAFSFKYSRRPGTPAAAMAGQIPEPLKDERLGRLQSLLAQQQADFNGSMIGARLPVLFEKRGRRAGQIVGKSPYLQAVHCQGPDRLIGQIAMVAIARAMSHSLAGALVEEAH
jgi:tRNA-2-methylthio-N6-dimethylallyladenosine synthase